MRGQFCNTVILSEAKRSRTRRAMQSIGISFLLFFQLFRAAQDPARQKPRTAPQFDFAYATLRMTRAGGFVLRLLLNP